MNKIKQGGGESVTDPGIQYFVVNRWTGRVWAKPVELVQPERRP